MPSAFMKMELLLGPPRTEVGFRLFQRQECRAYSVHRAPVTIAEGQRTGHRETHLHQDSGVYWKGTSRDSLHRARQLALDFLCASMGGPVIYLGREMKTLHEGMGISDADWEVLMRHARKTLDDLGIAEPERKEFCPSSKV
jgi:hypothetical protein